jgi:hypothetical protein
MGPGHLGIALAVKALAPKAPLGVLLAATEVSDTLFFIFQKLGLEEESVHTVDMKQGIQNVELGRIALSHGLLMSVVWAVLGSAIAARVCRDRRTSAVVGALVFSHWVAY